MTALCLNPRDQDNIVIISYQNKVQVQLTYFMAHFQAGQKTMT